MKKMKIAIVSDAIFTYNEGGKEKKTIWSDNTISQEKKEDKN